MEAKESRAASGVVVAFALSCLVGLIVLLTSQTVAAAPADDAPGLHIGISR